MVIDMELDQGGVRFQALTFPDFDQGEYPIRGPVMFVMDGETEELVLTVAQCRELGAILTKAADDAEARTP